MMTLVDAFKFPKLEKFLVKHGHPKECIKPALKSFANAECKVVLVYRCGDGKLNDYGAELIALNASGTKKSVFRVLSAKV